MAEDDRGVKLPFKRHIVLVGIMGAGKTSIGKRLASKLGLPFLDSDVEIKLASGYSLPEFFDLFGELEFREGESKVIGRLLDYDSPHVIATGGGSYLHPGTRQKIRERGVSIWVRASLDTLTRRVARRNNRPLLNKGNQREILSRIMEDRYSTYQEADITVDSEMDGPTQTVDQTVAALETFFRTHPPKDMIS